MRVYLSGPMSGLPENNRPVFDRAAEVLRSWGLEVVNPADVDRERPGLMWVEYMEVAQRAVLDPLVEAVVLLPGWEESRGARLEVMWAHRRGLAVFELGVLVDQFRLLSEIRVRSRGRRRGRRWDQVGVAVLLFVVVVAALWPLSGTGVPVALAFWLLTVIASGAVWVRTRDGGVAS